MRLDATALSRMLLRRQVAEITFRAAALAALLVALGSLAALLLDAWFDGAGRLSWQFLTSFPSRHPEQAGILAALVGSVAMIVLTAAVALPIGVGAAVYLEEYAGKTWWARVIEVNIANLAGVPSIVYGLLGLELFVRALKLDRSLLAGALTMALLVMPIIIISSREALRTVPNSIREASCALGATRWQTIWYQVLPMAFPGILTGSILAFSRAIGEAAPLITIGALTYVAFLPDGLLSPFTALPIQIFNWVSRPQAGFHVNAAAAIIVLLVVLLFLNATAVYLRHRFQRRVHL
jgi:phosphate transport system permease protein